MQIPVGAHRCGREPHEPSRAVRPASSKRLRMTSTCRPFSSPAGRARQAHSTSPQPGSQDCLPDCTCQGASTTEREVFVRRIPTTRRSRPASFLFRPEPSHRHSRALRTGRCSAWRRIPENRTTRLALIPRLSVRGRATRPAGPLHPYLTRDGPSTVLGVRFVEDKGSEDRNIRAVARDPGCRRTDVLSNGKRFFLRNILHLTSPFLLFQFPRSLSPQQHPTQTAHHPYGHCPHRPPDATA